MDDEDAKVLTLEPLSTAVVPHETVFINELKLSEFKQALLKANIPSEVQAGVLMCSNGTIAVRRVCQKMFYSPISCYHFFLFAGRIGKSNH